jgi:uncharacterized protein
MKFEWDEAKNRANIRKHGLSFAEAPKVFAGPILARLDLRDYYGERRWQGVGLLDNRVVVVVFTERDADTIRMISLRKAEKHEREAFQKALRD